MPPQLPSNHNGSTLEFSDSDEGHAAYMPAATGIGAGQAGQPGSYGFSSALGQQVLLRIRVTAGADVHFTTTISVYVYLPLSQTSKSAFGLARVWRCRAQTVVCTSSSYRL